MSFGNPKAGFLFLVLIALTVIYYLVRIRRMKTLDSFAERELLPLLIPAVKKRPGIGLVIFFAGLSCCILALMRPQFGLSIDEAKKEGHDIIFALDTSMSMLAEDVKPNRLELSKAAVGKLVEELKGDRIGLVVFSGSAFTACPLTSDYNGFMLTLNSTAPDLMPVGGTDLLSAIRESAGGFRDDKEHGAIVLISDGEDHGESFNKVVEGARKEGVRVFTVGVGTTAGGLIPITDEKGRRAFLRDRQGHPVLSRLHENHLEQIASAAQGAYMRLSGTDPGLRRLYEERISRITKKRIGQSGRKRYREWFQVPLFAALLLLSAEVMISCGGG